MLNDPNETLLSAITSQAYHDVQDLVEKHLLDFFGSRELAEKYAYLYTIEEETQYIGFDPKVDSSMYESSIKITYRVRPKTPEELSQE